MIAVNGTQLTQVLYDGVDLDVVKCNDVIVFQKSYTLLYTSYSTIQLYNMASIEYNGVQYNNGDTIQITDNVLPIKVRCLNNVLSCYDNSLTALDVTNNTTLTELYCNKNNLTALDVSNNTALTILSCNTNILTTLDVSNNTALVELQCVHNNLTALDVSNNTLLTALYCSYNNLTALDLSNNTALINLNCNNNKLTALDLSNNTALTTLYCGHNNLTALDLSNNTALTALYCSNNNLTALDLSNNTALINLQCITDTIVTGTLFSDKTKLESLLNSLHGNSLPNKQATISYAAGQRPDNSVVQAAKNKGWSLDLREVI